MAFLNYGRKKLHITGPSTNMTFGNFTTGDKIVLGLIQMYCFSRQNAKRPKVSKILNGLCPDFGANDARAKAS